MADEMIMDEMDNEGTLITLEDEEGNEVEFEFLDVIEYEGEEFIVVISGEIELMYGEETTILKPGDSAYYNSVVKHRVAAAGGKPATIYAAIFMPYN